MPRFLNAGCGARDSAPLPLRFRDWEEVRLDSSLAVEPDFLAPVTELPFDDDSFDAVYCSHTLEHLPEHEVPLALKEFRRVLKAGNRVYLHVPDLKVAAQRILDDCPNQAIYQSPAGPVAALDMVYGFRPFLACGIEGMEHRTGFTLALLSYRLEEAGLRLVEIVAANAEIAAVGEKP